MKTSTKIWFGIGAAVGVAVIAGVDSVPSAIPAARAAASGNTEPNDLNDFSGDLGDALKKIFAGEGGEGGIGLGPMWPSVRAPALTNAQLQKVIPGNTLRNDYRTAVYYNSAGTLEGWITSYSAIAADQIDKLCTEANVAAYKYYRSGSKCWERINNPLSGSWKIANHKLCTDITSQGKRDSQCWHVALVLDRIALFDENGALNKLGRVLKQGKVLAQKAD